MDQRMIIACLIYLLVYAALMLLASVNIDTDNRNRGIVISGINVLAAVYLLVNR